ncbi:MAG: class I SAM-dependent methyltransferase [Alcanivoracaceae bacterium]
MDLPRLLRSPFRRPPPDTDLAFADWLDSDSGQAMLAEQRLLLDDILVRSVGYHALQCGVGRSQPLLGGTRIRRHHYLGRRDDPGASVVGDPACLPFANHSLDLVLMHHSLDFEANPHEVLREATRTLIPGGTLVVIGFNPFSLWGLTRLLRIGSGRLPWLARFLPAQRVHDWLGVLGLELEGYESAHYVMPLAEAGRSRFSLVEQLGRRFWPRRGAFYILVARKRAAMIRPLRPRFALPERSPQVIPVPLAHWQRRIRRDQEGQDH